MAPAGGAGRNRQRMRGGQTSSAAYRLTANGFGAIHYRLPNEESVE